MNATQLQQPHDATAGCGRGRRRGSATLETGLVLFFVLIPLTFGAIEYSYAFYVKNTLQAAAREAVRRAIVPGGTRTAGETEARQRVLKNAFTIPENSFTFDWKGTDPTNDAHEYITCEVIAPTWSSFPGGMRPLSLTPLFSAAAPSGTKQLKASATMRQE